MVKINKTPKRKSKALLYFEEGKVRIFFNYKKKKKLCNKRLYITYGMYFLIL